MTEDHRLGDACSIGDLTRRNSVKAVPGEQLGSNFANLLFPVWR
jgi:hypothetical protein